MTINELQQLVRDIVSHACELKDKHTNQHNAPVHYAAIFSQSKDEYEALLRVAGEAGTVHKATPTGPLFRVAAIQTEAGQLRLLKIRAPDPTRPERGDADFAARDYAGLKASCLSRPGFALIQRDTFEMIELVDSAFDVRVYFSNPPVEVQHGLA